MDYFWHSSPVRSYEFEKAFEEIASEPLMVHNLWRPFKPRSPAVDSSNLRIHRNTKTCNGKFRFKRKSTIESFR